MSDDQIPNDQVLTDSTGRPISQAVHDELLAAAMRIRPAASARLVWERLFSEKDRQKLGNDFQSCWRQFGTEGMWMKIWDVSAESAVIDIAEGLDLMSSGSARYLRRALNLDHSSQESDSVKPVWNPDRQELRLGNRLVRRVRVMKVPSKIQRILDAFQAKNWPNRIENPLRLGQQELHQTLSSLNDGLKEIRFRASEGATSIFWERI